MTGSCIEIALKAPEGWRIPRRFANWKRARTCASFWSTAVFCCFSARSVITPARVGSANY